LRNRQWIATLGSLTALIFSHAAHAQAPTAYTITEINSMMGPSITMKVYRDGSKAIVDNTTPGADGKTTHTRSFYDLQAGRTTSWDLDAPAPECSDGKFSGSWGDPFQDSASMTADLAKQGAKDVGVEAFLGIQAKVLEVTQDGAVFKVWLDPKTGLMLKVDVTQNGQKRPFMEVKEISMTKPSAAVFAIPAACRAAASAPMPPTENERFAAETGGAATDFISAIAGPASANSCTMLFKAVNAGAMQPVTGYKISMDKVDKTAGMKDGVLRVENPPAHFNLDLTFGDGGGSSAGIYRLCPMGESVLLMVIRHPGKLGDGADWMWVKAGKLAK
jgi:hypothetical protein